MLRSRSAHNSPPESSPRQPESATREWEPSCARARAVRPLVFAPLYPRVHELSGATMVHVHGHRTKERKKALHAAVLDIASSHITAVPSKAGVWAVLLAVGSGGSFVLVGADDGAPIQRGEG